MTSKNTPLSNPVLLKPVGKDYLWGGSRLRDDFAKSLDISPLAETWECSTHPDGLSIIASGFFEGQTLGNVLKSYPAMLGARHMERGSLPILIKLIDAKQNLSIQVHPDDSYAMRHENGQMGKTELWYVLDAAENSSLIYGLRRSETKEKIRRSIENGTLEKYLQRIPIHTDDIFFIPPGTIHALGAGSLVAEIQESSNLTYRLYDYKRLDKQGKPRELHIEKALDVAVLSAPREPRQPLRVLRFQKGCAFDLICRCKYFQVERMIINTERFRTMAEVQTDRLSFQVLLCIQGCGVLFAGEETIPFFRGDCIFLPACARTYRIHAKAKFLKIRC